MEPRFVGALIRDDTGNVLLERRTQQVSVFRGLWSLPGGCVESGETGRAALGRELEEELGASPSIGPELYVLDRARGEHTVYAASLQEEARIAEPTYVAELKHYPPWNPPECSTIDTALSLFRWANDHRVLELSCGALADRLFSSVFYSYLYPVLIDTWPEGPTRKVLLYTIEHTPLRKFKGALPFLLGRCADAGIRAAITAEVLFSTFYVLDDLCDDKTGRYGRPTAYGAFGRTKSAAYLLALQGELQKWLSDAEVSLERERATECIRQLCAQQQDRCDAGPTSTMETYRASCVARTQFLGDLWALGCERSGASQWRQVVDNVYGECAFAGQLKNDLRDADIQQGGRCEDIARGIITGPTIRFLERCDRLDETWFMRDIWARGWDYVQTRLDDIALRFEAYEVTASLRRDIDRLADDVDQQVASNVDASSERTVFSAWVDLQLRNEQKPVDWKQRAELIKAVEALTAAAKLPNSETGFPSSL